MNEVYDVYMKQRLLDVALGRRKVMQSIKGSISEDDISRFSDDEFKFLVKSQCEGSVVYTVDLKVGICDCINGQTGKACKHQIACSEKFLVRLPQVYLNTPENRQRLVGIALGKENMPPLDFFATLEENPNDLPRDCKHISPDVSYNTECDEVEIPSTSNSDNVNIPQEELEYSTGDSGTETNPTKPSKAFLEKLKLLHDTISDLASKYEDEHSLEAIERLIQKAKTVRTSNQLNSLLHCTGAAMPGGYGRCKIPCQPTSVARRQVGMPRGAAPIAKGRKRKGNLLDKVLKRQRNLSLNVSLNQPNAKSHGTGH